MAYPNVNTQLHHGPRILCQVQMHLLKMTLAMLMQLYPLTVHESLQTTEERQITLHMWGVIPAIPKKGLEVVGIDHTSGRR